MMFMSSDTYNIPALKLGGNCSIKIPDAVSEVAWTPCRLTLSSSCLHSPGSRVHIAVCWGNELSNITRNNVTKRGLIFGWTGELIWLNMQSHKLSVGGWEDRTQERAKSRTVRALEALVSLYCPCLGAPQLLSMDPRTLSKFKGTCFYHICVRAYSVGPGNLGRCGLFWSHTCQLTDFPAWLWLSPVTMDPPADQKAGPYPDLYTGFMAWSQPCSGTVHLPRNYRLCLTLTRRLTSQPELGPASLSWTCLVICINPGYCPWPALLPYFMSQEVVWESLGKLSALNWFSLYPWGNLSFVYTDGSTGPVSWIRYESALLCLSTGKLLRFYHQSFFPSPTCFLQPKNN